MTLKEAIQLLKTHNQWRRGADVSMAIGINIVSYLKDFAEDILKYSDQQTSILTQKLMEANHQLEEALKEREMFKDALIKLGDSYIELKSQADAMDFATIEDGKVITYSVDELVKEGIYKLK